MDMGNEQKQHLLFSDEEEGSSTSSTSNNHLAPKKRFQLLRPINPFLLIFIFLSVATNAFFFSTYFIHRSNDSSSTSYVSHNLKLAPDVRTFTRWRYTMYSHPNETIRNEAWDSIDIDRTIVAVDHEEAVALGLAPTEKFPWDESKDIYAVSAYHQFHCLKLLYRSLQEAHHGQPFSNDYNTHILHCLDSLRGDFECFADDHLFSVSPGYNPPIDEGQPMQCRSFSALDAWALEHHSCFKYNYISDIIPETEMHQWRNCPKDSPYAQTMRDYFGYKDDWDPEKDWDTERDGPFVPNFGAEFPEGMDERQDSWSEAS